MARAKTEALILTCEHGGNRVPREYAAAFRPLRGMLATHRGWDPGALVLSRRFAKVLLAPLFAATVSRLVVDLNRSEGHPRVYSRVTAALPEDRRQRLLAKHYRPFRGRVAAEIAAEVRRGRRVVHVSVHSFTPVLAGEIRNADIGLLYDPRRPGERALAAAWRKVIRSLDPKLRVRMNYPYLGTSDGHTTSLRGRFRPGDYIGIELEVNQALVRAGGARWAGVQGVLTRSLALALAREPL